MLPFSLFLALKYLRPKRSFVSVVTVISILGVLLGVAILVIVLSVMTGFDNMWREKILSFKPHMTVTSRMGVPGITGASPSVETRVMLQYEGRMSAPVVLGLDPARAGRISRLADDPAYMHAGKFDLADDAIVLGIDTAMRMGVMRGATVLVYSPSSVGDPTELHLPEELRVSGIFDMGMRDFDAGYVFTSIGVARDLVGIEEGAFTIYVMTDDAFKFGPYSRAVSEALGPQYEVRTWKEIDQLLFDALSHEKTMMFVLLVFITVVAIFCVTNTLIVITVQKTREIGLLKALGFPTWKITAAFVCHGWIQCLAGTVAGIGVGMLVLINLKRIVRFLGACNVAVFPKDIYGLSEIPWSTSPRELLQVGLFVMVFCTVSSILPAWRAARLDPVEALRQE